MGNLAIMYEQVGRNEEALKMYREVYSERLKLHGKEHRATFAGACNYADTLVALKLFKEARALMRKTIPGSRRVLGEGNEITLLMRTNYAQSLYKDAAAALDDLREAVTTLEETEAVARRVLGSAHPTTEAVERALRGARATLRAREPPSPRTFARGWLDGPS